MYDTYIIESNRKASVPASLLRDGCGFRLSEPIDYFNDLEGRCFEPQGGRSRAAHVGGGGEPATKDTAAVRELSRQSGPRRLKRAEQTGFAIATRIAPAWKLLQAGSSRH